MHITTSLLAWRCGGVDAPGASAWRCWEWGRWEDHRLGRSFYRQNHLECRFIEEQYSSMQNIQQMVAFATAARTAALPRRHGSSRRRRPRSPRASAGWNRNWRDALSPYDTAGEPHGRRQQLFSQCQRILDEVELLRSAAAGARGEPSGLLRIEAPLTYGKRVVLPVLAKLLERHPRLRIDARLSDQVSDVIREGLDAVIRTGALGDSRLVARQIGQQSLVVCASPAYLERHGTPRSPADLGQHQCLLFRMPSSGRDRPWQFRIDGDIVEVQPTAACGWVMARRWWMPRSRDSALRRCRTTWRPTPTAPAGGRGTSGISRSAHSDQCGVPTSRMLPPRVRVLIDALSERGAAKLRIRLG
jgi:DNA-binding transcriptional LysR family regulator